MTTTLLKCIADLRLSLASAVNIGDTTATLSSATDSDGVALPAGKYGFTIDRGTAGKEYIVADLSGTALTGVLSITRQGASASGFDTYHRGGASVEITDWAILSRILNNLSGATGFDSGVNLGYDAAPAGLTGNQFATVNYVLSVVAGGAVSFDQQVVTNQTAGENLTAGNIVYFKESDQKWWKADADLTATFDQLKLGVALATVSADASVSIGISGPIAQFSGLTLGSRYYLSNTAGGVSTSAGTNRVFLGWALTATTIIFSPREIEIPTGGQRDAMAGTTDTPSSTNPFMTRNDNRAGLQKSVTAGATINGATLPVPVYQNTTDNQYYACDGNDLATLKFQGFAVSNSTDNNPINIQTGGIVSGFSGLDEGVAYFVSDTVGTIQNSPGTYPVMVGVAISTTELLIQKGKRYASGTIDFGSTTTSVVTVGFRVQSVKVFASTAESDNVMFSNGGWTVFGGNDCSYGSIEPTDSSSAAIAGLSTTAWNLVRPNGTVLHQGTVTTITATTFTLDNTENTGSVDAHLTWMAEGDF